MQGQDTGISISMRRRRHEMSPLDMTFMAAVVFAMYKIIDLAIVWYRKEEDDEENEML